jgi:tetratricopeptide (TPR) repeat protein
MRKCGIFSFLCWFALGAAAGMIGCRLAVRGPMAAICGQGAGCGDARPASSDRRIFDTDFGNWLAANHAVSVDDFERAREFLSGMKKSKSGIVSSVSDLVAFLDGGDASGAPRLRMTNGTAYRIMNASVLANGGRWKAVLADFKGERSQILAPFRIWSLVATENFTKAAAFIGDLPASESWRNFARGCIYAATKNPKTARKFFRIVPVSFLNLGDYHLVMSFYKKYGFDADADDLRARWTGSPGGMFMSDLDLGEDWQHYDSYQKMLAAMLIQNVSHSGEGGYGDRGLLLLKSAGLLGGMPDGVNYYTGMYFYAAGSPNYKKYWGRLADNPIYAPFIEMKEAEAGPANRAGRRMDALLRKNPLFMPAVVAVWRRNMQNGREGDVLRMLNRALRRDNVPDAGRAYLLKLRGQAMYIFGDLDAAEADLEAAAELAPMDAGIMGVQARVWAARGEKLDEAYRFAISLIKAFPSNAEYWDILAAVVRAKEGDGPALEILEKIGRVAEECSALFQHLGDLRARAGLAIGAGQAYRKAIVLSDDGLVIKADVERKLKKLGE